MPGGNNGLSLRAKRVILFARTSSAQSAIVYRRISRVWPANRSERGGIKANQHKKKKKYKINNKKVRFRFGRKRPLSFGAIVNFDSKLLINYDRDRVGGGLAIGRVLITLRLFGSNCLFFEVCSRFVPKRFTEYNFAFKNTNSLSGDTTSHGKLRFHDLFGPNAKVDSKSPSYRHRPRRVAQHTREITR